MEAMTMNIFAECKLTEKSTGGQVSHEGVCPLPTGGGIWRGLCNK